MSADARDRLSEVDEWLRELHSSDGAVPPFCIQCGTTFPCLTIREWDRLSASLASSAPAATSEGWRIGQHYAIHVYAGDRPVATFHRPEDAARATEAVNRALNEALRPVAAS